MTKKTHFRAWLAAGILLGPNLPTPIGCSAGGSTPGKAVGNDGNGGSSTSGTGGASGTGTIPTTGGTGSVIPEGGPAGSAGMGCGSVRCDPVGGNYCGQIGDECGGSLDCG